MSSPVEIRRIENRDHRLVTVVEVLNLSNKSLGERFDYHVCVHRFDRWEDYFVYPAALDETLPEIAIPLWRGDGEIAIDSQEVFQRTYDAGAYSRRVRYGEEEIVPPLDERWRTWVSEVIASAGRR